VALAGRSNVGKSSAINCLLRQKALARTSSTPGRTQHINLYQVADQWVLADLPGYGYARVPTKVQDEWRSFLESYLADREGLRLVVVIVDARREPDERDGQLLWALTELHLPSLVVATKIDKLAKREVAPALQRLREEFRLPPAEPVPFSAATGEGREAFWRHLRAAVGGR
jgi:GTP-binding protein